MQHNSELQVEMQHNSKLKVEMQHNSKLWTKAFITVYCVITPGASDDHLDDDDYDDNDDIADVPADADADHSDQQLLSLPCDCVSCVITPGAHMHS